MRHEILDIRHESQAKRRGDLARWSLSCAALSLPKCRRGRGGELKRRGEGETGGLGECNSQMLLLDSMVPEPGLP